VLTPHEYSIIGHSRSTIGRYLGVVAASIAAGSAVASGAATGIAHWLGLSDWVSHITVVPLSAAAVYPVAHWIFDRFAWKYAGRVLNIPDISGDWQCHGTTLLGDGTVKFRWHADITISQSWEKIHVTLRTRQSASHSVSAALIPEADGSWMLMYSYRNEPRAGEPELNAHLGYCEMRFNKLLRDAEGDYFNARGRGTFGRMQLTKKV
jgi:hypothetical protein